MANGMGSLYIGASGLQSSQNALNTTSNNLANVDTKGYVRQQVLFTDRNYTTFDRKSAISKQQAGLGVTIGDVVHTRDLFLDKYYRNEAGRQAFYEATYIAVNEVEDVFQEMEGASFQDTLEGLWNAFQEFSKEPDLLVKQNHLIEKATLFTERVQSINDNLRKYQKNMNLKIQESTEKINELGKKINNLNQKIISIEAGGVETAMTLRDERDLALDELASLVNIDYKELPNGLVKVKIEGVSFVDEARVFEMGLYQDKLTDFVTPYWPHLSDESKNQYDYVFDTNNLVSSANNTDIGKLKALIIARGDHYANYSDIEGKSQFDYNTGVGNSVVMNAEAELDQLVHKMATTINDIFCPNISVNFTGADGTVYNNVKVWDAQNGAVGKDGKPHEFFTRRGCDRYKEVLGDDGKTYYVYNEENPNDTSKQYTTRSISVNHDLIDDATKIPHLTANGEVDMKLGERLNEAWEKDQLLLNPNDTDACTFKEYYQRMIDDFASKGSVCSTLSTTLAGSVTSFDNQRQQVIGVSSDEELTNMIKYQNAYNAASRYINVISEMLEHLVTQLGA